MRRELCPAFLYIRKTSATAQIMKINGTWPKLLVVKGGNPSIASRIKREKFPHDCAHERSNVITLLGRLLLQYFLGYGIWGLPQNKGYLFGCPNKDCGFWGLYWVPLFWQITICGFRVAPPLQVKHLSSLNVK